MAGYYLAYGSNMNTKQMEVRCPSAKVVGKTMLEGYELLFKGRQGNAYATIRRNPKKNTPVVIWEIDDLAERRLDNYEGFPTLYVKAHFRVELDGKAVEAMAYVMQRGHRLAQPDRHYFEEIIEGYTSAGFDLDILEEALRASDQKASED